MSNLDLAYELKKVIFAVQKICLDEDWSKWAKNWIPKDEEGALCAQINANRASQVQFADGQWRTRVEMALASEVSGLAATYAAAQNRYCHTVHPSYPAKGQGYFMAINKIVARCPGIIARANELAELAASETPRLFHGETFNDTIGPVGCHCPICTKHAETVSTDAQHGF